MSFWTGTLITGLCGAGLLCAQTVATPPQSGTSTQSSGTSGQSEPSTQSQTPPKTGTSSSTSPNKPNEGTFVRRFGAGATLSVLGLSTIPGGSSSATPDNNTNISYTTKGVSQRIGYGITAQIAITNHIAVAVGAYLHRIGYQFDTQTTIITPTVVGSTVVNQTSTTSTHEDTRARLLDIPLLIRYYGKNRHTAGPRWFAEAGGTWREVRAIRTSVDSLDTNGNLVSVTHVAAQPANRNARGFSGGAGLQLIDPLGIRVVPEVRYTRWVNQIFSSVSTHTARNEVEACLTLSY